MEARRSYGAKIIQGFIASVLISACVEPVNFDVPPAQLLTIVDGMISDKPGPYTVFISRGLPLDADSTYRIPYPNVKVVLWDFTTGTGVNEVLTEVRPGEYITGGVIQGKVGGVYSIRIETPDGGIYESELEVMFPVGAVKDIRYEYEARSIQKTYGTVPADVFKISIDAEVAESEQSYARWRFKGTYKVSTRPELYYYIALEFPLKAPFICSGYIVVPLMDDEPEQPPGEGKLAQVGPCTCCICYVNDFETVPQISDGQFVAGEYKNVKVAEVNINTETFFEKYLVEIEQMSLSKNAYDFFKIIKAQKEGAAGLFQAPAGEVKGNIRAIKFTQPIVGIFYASSIKSRSIYIPRSAVPYALTRIKFIDRPCDKFFDYSSTSKPILWQ
ncbi:MAG: DUF4249 family protein [Cyclobacteriaceae bacterium]|nr:DUF4249 family protein [Cyclobacteriaceae bacterium]